MPRTLDARRARALVAVVTAAASLSACSAWRPMETPYRKAIADHHPDRVRVTRDDGSMLTLEQPAVVSDSLVGFTSRKPPRDRASVPLARVTEVRTQHTKGLATAGVVALVLVSVVAVVVATADLDFGGLGSWSVNP